MKSFFAALVIGGVIFAISGCQLDNLRNQSQSQHHSSTTIVEQPPKIISTDWQVILSPLVEDLLQTAEITENNLLLISDIKNSSGSYISTSQINRSLNALFNQQDIFLLADKQTVNQAKQNLGIPYDDSLVSRSKMLGLARNIQADYLLFTTVNKAPKQPDIQASVILELLFVKNGEIVWQLSTEQLATSIEQQKQIESQGKTISNNGMNN